MNNNRINIGNYYMDEDKVIKILKEKIKIERCIIQMWEQKR